MRLITGQDEIVAQFVGAGLKKSFTPPYTAIGWVREQGDQWRLVGGAVFNDYNGANIEVSIYGPHAMNRQTLREALRYVFLQCKCQRLTARTERGNKRMIPLLNRLGFVYEGKQKYFFGSTKSHDALMFRMDPDSAERWIYGKRTVAAARS